MEGPNAKPGSYVITFDSFPSAATAKALPPFTSHPFRTHQPHNVLAYSPVLDQEDPDSSPDISPPVSLTSSRSSTSSSRSACNRPGMKLGVSQKPKQLTSSHVCMSVSSSGSGESSYSSESSRSGSSSVKSLVLGKGKGGAEEGDNLHLPLGASASSTSITSSMCSSLPGSPRVQKQQPSVPRVKMNLSLNGAQRLVLGMLLGLIAVALLLHSTFLHGQGPETQIKLRGLASLDAIQARAFMNRGIASSISDAVAQP